MVMSVVVIVVVIANRLASSVALSRTRHFHLVGADATTDTLSRWSVILLITRALKIILFLQYIPDCEHERPDNADQHSQTIT